MIVSYHYRRGVVIIVVVGAAATAGIRIFYIRDIIRPDLVGFRMIAGVIGNAAVRTASVITTRGGRKCREGNSSQILTVVAVAIRVRTSGSGGSERGGRSSSSSIIERRGPRREY